MPRATSLSSDALYRMAEKSKEREYASRIRNVEHADFNPLVFTTAGGMGAQCQATISDRRDLNSVVAGWLRCRLSFALLRTTLLCVRGTRARKFNIDPNIELSVAATRIEY